MDHTNTILVQIDWNKGFFTAQAEQLDGSKVMLIQSASWAAIKANADVARCRDELNIPIRASQSAMRAIKKQVMGG